MDNMRERLIELMLECDKENEIFDCFQERPRLKQAAGILTDHLLANGVILPPCKVGDTVYRVMSDKRIKQPYEYKVIGFWYSADETCNNLHLVRYVNGKFDSSMSVPFCEFNRILFLTREEAEQALKERDNND